MPSSFRSFIVTIIFAALIYAGYCTYLIRHSLAVSKILIDSTLPYKQHPIAPNYRVLIAGDSTAVGVGAGDPKLSTAGRLGRDMPNADITNIAVSGIKVGGLQATLLPVAKNHYDLMIIQIGANDIIGPTSYDSVRKSLHDSLATASGMADRILIITGGDFGRGPVFHWPVTVYLSHRTQVIRQIFMEESARYSNIKYLDIYTTLANIDFNTDVPRWYAADAFHLSAEGYALWYGEMQKALL